MDVIDVIPANNPEELESTYVHEVYNEIAPHFSQTRYKVRFRLLRSLTIYLTTSSLGRLLKHI